MEIIDLIHAVMVGIVSAGFPYYIGSMIIVLVGMLWYVWRKVDVDGVFLLSDLGVVILLGLAAITPVVNSFVIMVNLVIVIFEAIFDLLYWIGAQKDRVLFKKEDWNE